MYTSYNAEFYSGSHSLTNSMTTAQPQVFLELELEVSELVFLSVSVKCECNFLRPKPRPGISQGPSYYVARPSGVSVSVTEV